MNIHQKLKTSSSVNASATKDQTNANPSINEFSCTCSFKINLLSQQIANINQKISIVVRLMEIPCTQVDKPLESSQNNPKNLISSIKNEGQKQSSEQSFLLEGIESETGRSEVVKNCTNLGFKSNLLVGKEIAFLKSKLKELEQKSQQISKLRTNFSLLTKIVDKIGHKMEIQANVTKLCSGVLNSKSNSNCTIQDDERRINQRGLSTVKDGKQKTIHDSAHWIVGEVEPRRNGAKNESAKKGK